MASTSLQAHLVAIAGVVMSGRRQGIVSILSFRDMCSHQIMPGILGGQAMLVSLGVNQDVTGALAMVSFW